MVGLQPLLLFTILSTSSSIRLREPAIGFTCNTGLSSFTHPVHLQLGSVSCARSAGRPPNTLRVRQPLKQRRISRISGIRIARAAEEQPIKTALDGKSTVLVVGANRGLGLEFTKQLLKKGCHVLGTIRGPQSKELQALKCDRLFVTECEVTEQESVMAARAVLKSKARSGLTHIIHSAGVNQLNEDSELNFDLVSPEEMTDVFKINCVGPLLTVQNFLPLCAEPVGTRVPVIAFLSSKVASISDNQSGGLYAYRTSKTALNNLAKNLYIDLKDTAAVVLLHPGYVRTSMTDYMGFIDPPESVSGMLNAIQATDSNSPFRWVDFAGDKIEW